MCKEISFCNNLVAAVDDKDFELIQRHRWSAHKLRHSYYAITNIKTGGGWKTLLMHRLIMGAKKGQQIDHINGNGLDNRRSNLRFCNYSQNHQNQFISRGASGFKGVSWQKSVGRWQVAISVYGKRIFLGLFQSQSEAAKAYDEAAIKYFGEFANLNLRRSA